MFCRHITPATGAQRKLRPANEVSKLVALVMGHVPSLTEEEKKQTQSRVFI